MLLLVCPHTHSRCLSVCLSATTYVLMYVPQIGHHRSSTFVFLIALAVLILPFLIPMSTFFFYWILCLRNWFQFRCNLLSCFFLCLIYILLFNKYCPVYLYISLSGSCIEGHFSINKSYYDLPINQSISQRIS